jgi:hypothetical protein
MFICTKILIIICEYGYIRVGVLLNMYVCICIIIVIMLFKEIRIWGYLSMRVKTNIRCAGTNSVGLLSLIITMTTIITNLF